MPNTAQYTYVPPGAMTREMLKSEAMSTAKLHSAANGGGRPFLVDWIIRVHERGATLVVSYNCNRPTGHCGRYVAECAL